MVMLNAVNTQIASKTIEIDSEKLTFGGFKLVHFDFGTINRPIWVKGDNKTAIAKRDDDGKIITEEVPGFTLFFAYKSVSKQWIGTLVTSEDGETLAKGCTRVDIPLPKQFNVQSTLYKLLTFLGVVEKLPESSLSEDELLEDEETVNTLDDDDLLDDVEVSMSVEADYSELETILPSFINQIFLAPYTINEKGYVQLNSNFAIWQRKDEVVNQKSKKK